MSAVWIGPASQLSSSQILGLLREERCGVCVIEIKLLESTGPLSSTVAASRCFEIDGNFANVAEENKVHRSKRLSRSSGGRGR